MSRWFHLALCFFIALTACVGVSFASDPRPFVVQVEPEQVRRGDAARVTVKGPHKVGVLEAKLNERVFTLVPVSDGRWEGFIGIDRDAETGPALVTIHLAGRQDNPKATVALTVADRTFIEQHLEVSESKVTLSKEDLARAAEERKEIIAALGIRTPESLWTKSFGIPVKGRISSEFGLQRYYNGKKKSYHSGLDIAAPQGTPVAASSDGKVVLTGDYFYTGLTVFVDHGGGLITAYFHMEALDVAQGDSITAGQSVGRVGSTGRSTGAHLHWGAYVSGVKVDPGSLVALTATEPETPQGQGATAE